jgi:hypothetical protein
MPPRRSRTQEPMPFAEPPLHRPRPATYTPRPLCYHPADVPLEKYENENKIFVPRITYQDLTSQLEDQQLLVVYISSPDNPEHRLIASVEAPHTGDQDEIYLPTYMLEILGAPEQVCLEFVNETLPIIAKLQLRILDNDWALADPVNTLQMYLEDYYVLQENITLNLQTQMDVVVPVFIEKLFYTDPAAVGSVGRIATGDTELEILRCEEENADDVASHDTTPSVAPQIPESAIPMIGDFTPPAYLQPPPTLPVELPSDAEKERMRQARLARFG